MVSDQSVQYPPPPFIPKIFKTQRLDLDQTIYTACKILISDSLINKISGINHLLDESAAFQGEKYRARHETALLCFLL